MVYNIVFKYKQMFLIVYHPLYGKFIIISFLKGSWIYNKESHF